MLTVKTVLFLTGLSIVGAIVLPFFGHSLDLVGVTALLSPIIAFAFAGKSSQSFSPNEATKPTVEQTPPKQQ